MLIIVWEMVNIQICKTAIFFFFFLNQVPNNF